MTTNPSKDIAGSEPLVDSVEMLWLTHTLTDHERECLEKSLHKLIAAHDTEKKQQVLKAIGEDDAPFNMPIGEPVSTYSNALKAELRQAVEEIYSQGGGDE